MRRQPHPGDHVGSTAPVFLAFLAVHVLAGLTAVARGGRGAGPERECPSCPVGRLFYRAIAVVFGTAVVLAAMRWREDYYLAIIGAVALGPPRRYQHRCRHVPVTPGTSPGWAPPTSRCSPRSTSTTALACRCGTAARARVLVLPSAIGAPVIGRAVIRARHATKQTRETPARSGAGDIDLER